MSNSSEEEVTVVAIRRLLEAIANSDNSHVSSLIEIFNVQDMDDQDYNDFYSTLVYSCRTSGATECLKTIINYFNMNTEHQDNSSLYHLYMLTQLSDEDLLFVKDTVLNTFSEVIIGLYARKSSDELMRACMRLYGLFKPSLKEFVSLKKEIDRITNAMMENVSITEFIQLIDSDISSYASIPRWVVDTNGNPSTPATTDLPNLSSFPSYDIDPLPFSQIGALELTPEQAAVIIVGAEYGEHNSRADALVEVEDKFREASESERQDMLLLPRLMQQSSLFNDPPADDSRYRAVFNLYGPLNQQLGVDLTDDDNPCAKYGGCRMFTCMELENYGDDEVEDPYDGNYTWFGGMCQKCLKKIRRLCHAVRIPRSAGGWQGCYCSFSCMNDVVDAEQAENGRIDDVQDEMMKIVEEKLDRYLIVDHIHEFSPEEFSPEEYEGDVDQEYPEYDD